MPKERKITVKLEDKETIDLPENFPLPTNKSVWVLHAAAVETKTKGGIIIPELEPTGEAGEGSKARGIIVALGPLVEVMVECEPNHPQAKINPSSNVSYRCIEPGDTVLFSRYQDTGVNIDGFFYIMMHESNVYSVLPDKNVLAMRRDKIDRRRAAVELAKSGTSGSTEIAGTKQVVN